MNADDAFVAILHNTAVATVTVTVTRHPVPTLIRNHNNINDNDDEDEDVLCEYTQKNKQGKVGRGLRLIRKHCRS